MTDLKNLCTEEADKERLLRALKKLRDAGVILIDDQAGRPKVLSAKKPNIPAAEPVKPGNPLVIDEVETLFELQDLANKDPYNNHS